MSLQPFVKWAGGKRQIMDKLLEFKPKKYKRQKRAKLISTTFL